MRFDSHWTQAALRRIRDLTPMIREFTIAPEGGAGTYPTGAHLMIRVLVGGRQDVRHYSLVGDAPVDGCWRIAVKREDPGRGGSLYMWSLREGARLDVAAPDSHFELSRDAPDYLLIAGGIGITPIRGMASVLRRRKVDFRMSYAGRSRLDMAYLDELEAELGPALEVFVDDQDERIDLHAAFARLSQEGEAYVCGPLGLLEAVKRAWAATGRPRAKLVFETFGSSGRFAAETFTVIVPRLGLTLAVSTETTMLDALEAAGVGVLSDCRRGECGLCSVEILDVQGTVDHRDVFFSDHEHAASRKMCACVSRVTGGSITIDPAYRGDCALTPGTALRRTSLVLAQEP